MWRADFLRCKQSERAAETASRQVLKDAIEAERHMAGDVLEEDAARSKSSDELEDDRPQMTRVVFSQSLSCLAEGLTWVSPAYPIDSHQGSGGKVSDISTPYRAVIQPPRLHLADQVRDAEGFPLHHADRARASANGSKSCMQSKVESADPGAD